MESNRKRVRLERDLILLVKFAKLLKVDYVPLCLLYKKFGRNCFLFFYLFMGATLKIPNEKNYKRALIYINKGIYRCPASYKKKIAKCKEILNYYE